ncbi:tRNA lysidine(34) synthetase TilS [Flammeovirga yaeyamensis]|uniref:tRNA(Ile)-lysidine synthase n=1 Tax=Flammeovirga yaeyamensis TaxID=367791 RepID=A0AAX1N8K0_9BACT|nr:tRNA lysidine(34) synthetase TilS [Flammeovirga yaeyamensis]MBB3698743.1 tRNA(Ile)-lysidine synthase [Flammeovirga yaeyamensis]NMF37329.1 tRNA lysidine(34) synthetase TilS [Flammeovirga yaeyamensis]QWG03853.1 tRNA lysidine(34) synthetase TilS [Flammeovirga yaeyamensis]
MLDIQNQFVDQFLTFINHKGISKKDNILLAFSGGVDSVALALLLKAAGYQFSLAHMNFQLRGEESNEDEAFARSFAEKHGISIFVEVVDTISIKDITGQSTQVLARELRYNWFDGLVKQHQFDFIATAHHQSDSVETVLYNLIKGTGIEGLHGIRFQRDNIVRPLLFTDKETIREFVKSCNEEWREDSSNQSNKYARNLIRNEVIPLLKRINPKAEESIAETSRKIRFIEPVFFNEVEEFKKNTWRRIDKGYIIKSKPYKDESYFLIYLYYHLKPFNFDFTSIEKLYNQLDQTALTFYSTDHKYVVYTLQDFTFHLIENEEPNHTTEKLLVEKEGEYQLNDTYIKIEKVEVKGLSELDKQLTYVQQKHFPFRIRSIENGDKIKPFGMKGKSKKVFDLLQDEGIPFYLRNNALVIEDTNQEILSVIAVRNSELLRIEEFPVSLFQITVK